MGVDPTIEADSERPWVLALVAAILLWINAAMLLDGYVWGQSDAWLLPFFLVAACLASSERWFWAGIACAIGCFFKAQLLLVAPLFFLWPLFGGKPLAALRAIFGFALCAALLLSPWLIHRDMSWYRISVVYGMHRLGQMTFDASNLAAIMGNNTYKWSLDDTVWDIRLSHPKFAYALTVRGMLIGIYALSLILCSAGAAMHGRRRSVGALAAIVAPWMILFAALPEMQPRYLIWAAALSAAMAGVSLGMTLMHFVVTLLAVVMMLRRLLPLSPELAPGSSARSMVCIPTSPGRFCSALRFFFMSAGAATEEIADRNSLNSVSCRVPNPLWCPHADRFTTFRASSRGIAQIISAV